MLRNARRALPRVDGRARGQLRRAVNELAVVIQRTGTVIAQARIRLAGGKPDSATLCLPRNTSVLVSGFLDLRTGS